MDLGRYGAASLVAQIETALVELVAGITPAPRRGPGRPPILPAAVVWGSLVIGVVRGAMSQAAIWRIVTERNLWRGRQIQVTDEAVYQRLADTDPRAVETLFLQITDLLVAQIDRVDTSAQPVLAPFASEVVAIDETTLDPVARSLPILRGAKPSDPGLLPGKLATRFDLRRQLWRTIELIDHPHQNEKVAARSLIAALPPGSLVLADLGYFGFQWFDDLTDAGHWWVSRCRAKTSYRIEHVHDQDDTTLDALVWLGANRSDMAKHLVRLVRFRTGQTERTYLTNVRNPKQLSMGELAQVYARRWDIELAVKLVKRELGLHLLWSAKPTVIQQQIWAVLVIAQILQAVRFAIACRANVELFDVSMALMIQYLPQYAARCEDPIAVFIADGPRMGFIRPSTRVDTQAPSIPHAVLVPPPEDLPLTRTPRYAHRKCGPRPAAPAPAPAAN